MVERRQTESTMVERKKTESTMVERKKTNNGQQDFTQRTQDQALVSGIMSHPSS